LIHNFYISSDNNQQVIKTATHSYPNNSLSVTTVLPHWSSLVWQEKEVQIQTAVS